MMITENINETEALVENLKKSPAEEVYAFIRQRLAFDEHIAGQLRHLDQETFKKEHRRFEMSGYEDTTGQCTLHNMSIVNAFADLGIYDYTHYLFLDFYKGQGTLFLRYFNDDKNIEVPLDGYRTVEIIYEIFKRTIFTGTGKRRRI